MGTGLYYLLFATFWRWAGQSDTANSTMIFPRNVFEYLPLLCERMEDANSSTSLGLDMCIASVFGIMSERTWCCQ